MSNEFSPSSVEGLWQSQPTEPQKIAPEDFHRKMRKFERKIAWRNIREYVAGALVQSSLDITHSSFRRCLFASAASSSSRESHM